MCPERKKHYKVTVLMALATHSGKTPLSLLVFFPSERRPPKCSRDAAEDGVGVGILSFHNRSLFTQTESRQSSLPFKMTEHLPNVPNPFNLLDLETLKKTSFTCCITCYMFFLLQEYFFCFRR